MIINIDLNEKQKKQLNKILKYGSDFIKNLVTEKLEEMEEDEKITEKEEKNIKV